MADVNFIGVAVGAYVGLLMAMISLVARRGMVRVQDVQETPWRGRVVGSCYIWREPSRWVQHFTGPDPHFPVRIFRENFRVPRALFYHLLCDLHGHDAEHSSTKCDAVGSFAIHAAMKVLAC